MTFSLFCIKYTRDAYLMNIVLSTVTYIICRLFALADRSGYFVEFVNVRKGEWSLNFLVDIDTFLPMEDGG